MARGDWDRLLRWGLLHQELFVFAGFMVLKVIAFQSAVGYDGGTLGTVLSTLALLLLLTGWAVLLPLKKRLWALAAADLLLTGLLLADALFYQNYQSVIVLPILGQAGQVGDVLGVLGEQVSWKEALLLADVIFLLPYAWLRGRRMPRARVLPHVKRLVQAGALTALSFLVLLGNLTFLTFVHGRDRVFDIYGNNTVLEGMGLLNFHAFDLVQTVTGGERAVEKSDVQIMRTWMVNHRREGQLQAEPRLFGEAQGKNLIMVQLEAMQGMLLGQKIGGREITPNLNRLAGESLYFDHFFPQIGLGVTSDAEFATFNSLYPLPNGSAYISKTDNTFQSLPKLLKERGYRTFAFHGYKPEFYKREDVYPREGFEEFYSRKNLQIDEVVGWGLSDESMYRQALRKMKVTRQPFLAFLLSLSGHTTYKIPDSKKELPIPEGQFSPLFTDYLHAQHYADKALGTLLDGLKREGLLDNSLLVVYGDHFGNSLQDGVQVGQFLGLEQVNTLQLMEMRKIPFLIRLPQGRHAGAQHIQAGQIDVLPTLGNLLGVEKEKMFYFGQDLLNAKSGYTAFRHYIGIGTFATDDLFYVLPERSHGHFEGGTCYDRKSGEVLTLNTCEEGYKRALWEFKMSDRIVEGNAVPLLVGKSSSADP